jgi:two-component system response regulator YesN
MYTIIIADDEPMMRKSMQLILQDIDLGISQVLLARDGEEALTLCEEYTPDIVVTDVRMPKMDGLDLCNKLYEAYNLTSLVILSGYDDFKYAQKALKYGVKDYLLKPVNREDFIACISSCLNTIKNNKSKIIDSKYSNLKKLINEDFGGNFNRKDYIQSIYKEMHNLPLNYCIVLAELLIQYIIEAVGHKTGEKLKFQITKFSESSKSEFKLWLMKMLSELENAINEIQVDIKYLSIKLAKEYIEKNYAKEFSLEDISGEIGFNPSYFSQMFKAKTGQTFVQYKNQVRLGKAKELLKKTDKSVTQVAMEVGYNDTSHFIKLYKKIIGETPNEYREKRGI